jgi:hypothetical protein
MILATVQRVTLVIDVISPYALEKMQKNLQFVLDMETALTKMFVHATQEKLAIDASIIYVMA